LDPSRAEAISPKNACGDDANALPISVLACNPPAAMMLIHPSRPASVQKSTLFSERLQKNTLWRGVPKELVASLLRSFEVHPLNISFQTEDLSEYLEHTTEEKLQNWDVVI